MGGCLLMVIMLFFAFPKTLNRMRQLEYLHFDYHSRGVESHYNMAVDSSQWNGANFRLAVWSCGWNLARHHLVTGVPLGDKQAALMEEYRTRDFMFAYDRHRNLHSTWLDVLVNTGIVGCIVFLLGYLVWPASTAIRKGDRLALLIVGAFATALSTETWIDGSFGTVLLAFWLSLVSAWQTPAVAPGSPLSPG
jgi:O-antigen ligase